MQRAQAYEISERIDTYGQAQHHAAGRELEVTRDQIRAACRALHAAAADLETLIAQNF
ncbi:hypothetical protein Pth03_78230 [Planotetraspora thailandica]|uniref:Uncharacterized protein n=1 Tax=Planotetraspora thailandica TaxID=487172 RepID=A0A8J3Y2A5_9ACTN|nr:hypothetical protein [Planotetraspora thailandica]GII59434.1 hypothetical protein Pth03_78230 [Planotetraspora thailandica]